MVLSLFKIYYDPSEVRNHAKIYVYLFQVNTIHNKKIDSFQKIILLLKSTKKSNYTLYLFLHIYFSVKIKNYTPPMPSAAGVIELFLHEIS